jgi:hypothetical protein
MKLRNLSRRISTFQLLHGVVCEKSGECRCVEFNVRGRTYTHRVPDSLTLAAGEAATVHESVCELPDVKAAIARGEVHVIAEPAEEPVESEESDLTAETQAGASGKRPVRSPRK